MRLHEAIRLGSMKRGPMKNAFLRDGKTCALGAAADAIGVLDGFINGCVFEDVSSVTDVWPVLNQRVTHPERPELEAQLFTVIVHLNDMLDWSREQIADWVEQIERAQEAPHPEQQLVTAD